VNDNEVEIYDWKYENYFFMWSNHDQVSMGGGGGQFGFVLDADFQFAETNPCITFGNPYLTTHRKPFPIENIEVWGFTDESFNTVKEELKQYSRENAYMMKYSNEEYSAIRNER
jgi:hypothetical protein